MINSANTDNKVCANNSPKNEIPINFIWMGGKVPKKYLMNIMECAAKALSDKNQTYTVNLWVDNPMNYYKSASESDISINHPRFKVRNLDELKDRLKASYDPELDKKISSYVNRELSGDKKNFAAASDALRYLILEQEGGFYFDTDTTFSVALDNRNNRIDPKNVPKGERGKFWEKEKMWQKNRDASTFFLPETSEFGAKMLASDRNRVNAKNGILFVDPSQHNCMKGVLEEVMKKVDFLDQSKYFMFFPLNKVTFEEEGVEGEKETYKVLSNFDKDTKKATFKGVEWEITQMDVKRSSDLSIGSALGMRGDRRNFTIMCSLAPLKTKLCELEGEGDQKLTEKTALMYDTHTYICFNHPFVITCDNTWLSARKPRSAEESDKKVLL